MKDNTPVALITGGARRIGAAIVNQLHHAGYRVAIHCNQSLSAAQALGEKLNLTRKNSAYVIQASLDTVTSTHAITDQLLAQWGRCDLLVNNASSFFPTPVNNLSDDNWDALFNSNAKAPLFLSQSLADALQKTQGSIINIADIHGQRPLKNHTIYCMAKAANIMLTQSLALELAPRIRVNGIAPGAILWPENSKGNGVKEEARRLKSIPLGELGGSDAIAKAVLFLASQDNYITGQILNIDGGKTLIQ